jgi:hypothetical protein
MNQLLIFFVTILSCYSLKIDNSKFCVNCKYFQPHVDFKTLGKCSKFLNPTPEFDDDYLVTGEIIDKPKVYTYASTARQFDFLCGIEGKLYEKKDISYKEKFLS